MLGKRPRLSFTKSSSMFQFGFDLNTPAEAPPVSPHCHGPPSPASTSGSGAGGSMSLPAAPTNQAKNPFAFSQMPDFLRNCSLCNRRLLPHKDIYMYRGNIPFCSPECREVVMDHEHKPIPKDKLPVPEPRKKRCGK